MPSDAGARKAALNITTEKDPQRHQAYPSGTYKKPMRENQNRTITQRSTHHNILSEHKCDHNSKRTTDRPQTHPRQTTDTTDPKQTTDKQQTDHRPTTNRPQTDPRQTRRRTPDRQQADNKQTTYRLQTAQKQTTHRPQTDHRQI